MQRCKDGGTSGTRTRISRLQGGGSSLLSYHPELVPGVGFEPTSPHLQRGAVTRSASQARRRELVRTRRIELLSPEWRSSIEPINYVRRTFRWCAPEDLNLSSADLPVSETPVLQTGGRRGTLKLEEGEGVEPSTVRSARFSRPVACRHAPPSEMVVPARLERATPAPGKRCSAPLSYGTELVRVVGFEPTASCVRGRHSRRTELHPAGAP
jgi:hypothetical protein